VVAAMDSGQVRHLGLPDVEVVQGWSDVWLWGSSRRRW